MKAAKKGQKTPRRHTVHPLHPHAFDYQRNHKWNDRDSAKVEALIGYSVAQVDIAAFIGMSHSTLLELYGHELDVGTAKSNARLAQACYAAALGTPAVYDANGRKVRDEVKPDLATLRFLCRVRLGWRETEPKRDPNDPPLTIHITAQTRAAVEALSDEDLATIARLGASIAAPRSDPGGDRETSH